MSRDDDDDDDDPKANSGGRFTEFTCSECNAVNPMDDGFKAGDEIGCHYCGCEFKVLPRDDGRVKLKLL